MKIWPVVPPVAVLASDSLEVLVKSAKEYESAHYTWVHLTRQDLSFLTRLVFFDKICFFNDKYRLFRQDLFFRRQILSFSTRVVVLLRVEKDKSCWKKQVLLKKTRFVVEKTNLVEKDKSCWKQQVLSKKTNLVVLDERPLDIRLF